MKYALLVASAAALGPVTLVVHHPVPPTCKEIDGFVKDCEEGLRELTGYLEDVLYPMKLRNGKQDMKVKNLADTVISLHNDFDQKSGMYLAPFFAKDSATWGKFV